MRVLVLGGTGEARELAAALVAAGVDVLSSLAGRVREPTLPEGPVRVGGFGGIDGLTRFLRQERITALVDATHPFAAVISEHAAVSADRAGVPRLVLRRPGWAVDPSWRLVPDMDAAAAAVRAWDGETVFLTTGRRDLALFSADPHRFLVRTVDPPEGPAPTTMTLLLDRGPYTVERERALMREHEVSLLVSKDSGGRMAEAKLIAARELSVHVLMVQRPQLPPNSHVASDVDAVLRWIAQLSPRRSGTSSA